MKLPQLIAINTRGLDLIGLALLTGLLIALAMLLLRHPAPETLLRKGDFPGFYAAAVLAQEQGGAGLYEREEQSRVQNRYWPTGQFYYFAYPPFFALFLRPLSFFEPFTAKLVYWALMAVCLVLMTVSGARLWPLAKRSRLFAAGFVMCCLPVLISFVIGQNTLLSMLVYTTGAALLLRGGRAGRFWGGFVFALWLFKPQLGLPALSLLLFSFDPLLLFGAGAGGLFCYLAGAQLSGAAWPLHWLAETLSFGAVNYTLNGKQMVSLGGMASVARSLWPADSIPAQIISVCHLLSAAAVFCIVASFFLKSFKARGAAEKKGYLRYGLALLGPATALLGEQVLFYDFGLALAGLLFFIEAGSTRALLAAVFVNLALSLCQYYYTSFAISPMVIATLCCFGWMLRMSESALREAGTGDSGENAQHPKFP